MIKKMIFSIKPFATDNTKASLETEQKRCESSNYTYTPKIGCHKLLNIQSNKTDWSEARKTCKDDGTDLAIVDTKAEEEVSRFSILKINLVLN